MRALCKPRRRPSEHVRRTHGITTALTALLWLVGGAGIGGVTRTFAVVSFAQDLPEAAADAHAEIVAGDSIGAVFASRGWTVTRRHRWFGQVPATDRVLTMMDSTGPADLATHVFELVVAREDASAFTYATIAEVHHPAYLSLSAIVLSALVSQPRRSRHRCAGPGQRRIAAHFIADQSLDRRPVAAAHSH